MVPWFAGDGYGVVFAAQLFAAVDEAANQTAAAANGEVATGWLTILALTIAAVSACAAWLSASAAWFSAKQAKKSAAAAEATAQVATRRQLVAFPRTVEVPFPGQLPAGRGYAVRFVFQSIGQQPVELSVPQLTCDPPEAFSVGQYEFIISSGQGPRSPTSDETVTVPPAGAAELTVQLAFSEKVATTGGGCSGTLQFPVAPTMSDGRDTIEIPCEFRAHACNH